MTRMLWLLACLALLAIAPARAAQPCPSAKQGGDWSAACFAGEGSERRVKPQYLKRLAWNQHGMATILVAEPRELLAVDRSGKVVIPNIRHTGDFDYPAAERGIGRFSIADAQGKPKCGYFAAGTFAVVVAPEYDQCQAFHDGAALACKDCVSYCRDGDCHDSVLVGGHGVVLAPDGKVVRLHTPPTLDNVCGQAGKASVKTHGATAVLHCQPAADSPFKL